MFDSIKRFGIIACLSLGLAFLMAMPVDVHAQAATGGIRGAVTDVTGAALPGATVTAKNPATGLESKTTTNSEGYFSIP